MRTYGLALILIPLLAASCSKDRDRGGRPIPKPKTDAGTDGGTIIPPGCENNPNGCVEHQLLAGDCSCLAACEGGYIWNGAACDPIPTAPDAGFDDGGLPVDTGVTDTGTPGPTDSGVNDTGTPNPPDSGMPPECTVNSDCPGGAAAACINLQTLEFCNGAPSGCACFLSCDPYASNNTCGGGDVCTWLGPPDPTYPLGLCLTDQGGGTQGQSCTAQFDAQGRVTSDSCNRTRNAICWGASPSNPIGVCATICGTNNPALCASFGNYTCDNLDDPTLGFGVCLNPRPNYNDIGNSCTAPTDCQGNFCSQILANSCSSMCAGLSTCPTGSYCLTTQAEGAICLVGCNHNGTTGDDNFCRNRNPETVCENFGDVTDPLGICIPGCVDNTQCNPGQICQNGHCI